VNAWVPLESWGRLNGLGKPIQLSNGTEAVYQLQTSNGLVLVKMGSHTANIRGLEYGLGFAPRLIRGLPYIHSIDAQKTLQALLSVLWPLPLKTRMIVIDPGHGGRDSGTRSVATHTPEKDYTLDWALRLKERLAASQWIVVLTRTNDADVTLAERVAVADRAGADLFVSLHLNSGGPNRQLSGVETYCLTPTGMPSNLLREYEDDPREAHPNNHFDDLNVQLATRLHRSILQTTGANDRGVRRARFMAVLRGQQRPAVLIEGGYLTHAEEARRLADPAYRQLLADAVAKALTE
jgi:N-acetylmuramoyl-L-alanine amidase